MTTNTNELSKQKKRKEIYRRYNEKNKERVAERRRRYYESHKEQIKNYNKQYSEKNKIRLANKSKKYREENKQYVLERDRKNRAKTKQQRKEYRKRYRSKLSEEQRERERQRRKQYYQKNKEYCLAYTTNYYKNRYNTDPLFKAKAILRSTVYAAFKRIGKNKTANTTTLLGCSWEQAKSHIESLWTEGMCWENHGLGKGKWNVDHIRPVSSFTESELDQMNLISNLQPLWHEDNQAKSDKYL